MMYIHSYLYRYKLVFCFTVLQMSYLGVFVSSSGFAATAESSASDLQITRVPDLEKVLEPTESCATVRSEMKAEAQAAGPDVPNNIKDTPRSQAQLGWSGFATVIAPNGEWQLEVHRALTSDENLTPVVIRSCRNAGAWPLFILERDADAYWGPDNRHLLVVNKPVSGGSQLLLFDVNAISQDKPAEAPDELDRTVKRTLLRLLGSNRELVFYLLTLASWKRNKLVLAIGGTSLVKTSNSNGSMNEYRYGFSVDITKLQVDEVQSADALVSASGSRCTTNP